MRSLRLQRADRLARPHTRRRQSAWRRQRIWAAFHQSADPGDGAVHAGSSAPSPSTTLPVARISAVAPPTVVVTAQYPRASAQTVSDTVATPIEQEVNGVEDMLYMSAQSTTDGQMVLTITFRLGTDLDKAQVLVQNRVAIAEPRLPEDVRRVGVTTIKSSPDLLMVVHLLSPSKRYDQLYIGNYALIQVRDVLARSTASATSACSASASTACGHGSIPTSSPAAHASPRATSSRRSATRTSRSPRA